MTEAKDGRATAPRFTDVAGRAWTLTLTVGSLIDVRRETGVDLAGALKSESALSDLIFGDPATLVSLLYVLCETQAKAAGVTPEQFGHGFDGRAVEAATEALLTAVADFFPRSRIGQAIRRNLAATMERAEDAAIRAIDAAGAGPSKT